MPKKPSSFKVLNVDDMPISDMQRLLKQLLRDLASSPFFGGILLDKEPAPNDPSTPTRTSTEPAMPDYIKLVAGASRDIPHGLGRRHKHVVIVSPHAYQISDDRYNIPTNLRDTHIRLFNGSGINAFVAVYVT